MQVTEIDSLNDTIDLIYMVEVVEHLTDPVFELSQIRKKISSTGTLFIGTRLGQMNESETNGYDTELHLHFFTPKSLNLALTKAGFSSIDYVQVPEIYPTVWNRGILRGLAASARNLFRVKRNYGHLVGFSYPI